MQFNFWWFTSDPGTNIIIATAIWFGLTIVCGRACSKGQKIGPIAYLGYAVASFGMGFGSVAGIYGYTIGAPFIFIGLLLVVCSTRGSESGKVSTQQSYAPGAPVEPQPRPASDEVEATCSECGRQVSIRGGTMKPDGSVVCPHCFKRFYPEAE